MTGEKWRTRRRILTPAFHFNVLKQFVEIFVEQSEKMVESLKREEDNVRDLSKFLTKFTLNTICGNFFFTLSTKTQFSMALVLSTNFYAETAMGTALQDSDSTQERFRTAVYEMGTLIIYR